MVIFLQRLQLELIFFRTSFPRTLGRFASLIAADSLSIIYVIAAIIYNPHASQYRFIMPLNIHRSAFFIDVVKELSHLEGQKLFEKLDSQRLDCVIKHQSRKLTVKEWELNVLRKMAERVDRRTELLPVFNFHTRKRSHSLGNQGRLYPTGAQGATAMHRQERYFMYSPHMIDIDAFAGHWSIVLNLATIDGIFLPAISKLIANRDAIRDRLSKENGLSASEAKQKINATLFGLNIKEWTRMDELLEAQTEIRKLYTHIRKVNSDLISRQKKKGCIIETTSLMARICEIHETALLEQILEFAFKTGVCDRNKPIVSLQHDGLMLEANSKLNDFWLRELEDFIEESSGFVMHYRFKSMHVKTPYH